MVGDGSQVPEDLGQQAPAAEYAGLHRAHRDPEDLGGGLQREALGVAEDDGQAELGGEAEEGCLQVGAQLDRLERGGRRGVGRVAPLGERLGTQD